MRMMLPLMDLFNHANADEANIAMFRDEAGDYVGYAKRDIPKGEQVLSFILVWMPGGTHAHAAERVEGRAAHARRSLCLAVEALGGIHMLLRVWRAALSMPSM
jgi:hypothetical protein